MIMLNMYNMSDKRVETEMYGMHYQVEYEYF